MTLTVPKPTGVRARSADGHPESQDRRAVVQRQATALAELSVTKAEDRLVLDWSEPLRHGAWYKAVYRPAVLRANRLMPSAALSPELKFHSLRHTYASLCVAAGIPPLEISRFMGHSKVTTTAGGLRAPVRGRPRRRDGRARGDGEPKDHQRYGQRRGDEEAAMNAGEVGRFCRVRRNRRVPADTLLVGETT